MKQAVSYSVNDGDDVVKAGQCDDCDWEQIPLKIKEAATTLGWDQNMRNKDLKPACNDMHWRQLTTEQQSAATVLGYNQDIWDNKPDSDTSDNEATTAERISQLVTQP